MSLEREDLGWGYMTSGLAALMCQEPPIRSPHVQLRFQGQIRIKHKEKFEEKNVQQNKEYSSSLKVSQSNF